MKYLCVMFPYPSREGLHLGHFYNYAVIDSYARYLKYKGEEVFQPFGYDSFGLPAENYARKIGKNPEEVTKENIENFRKQITEMNTCFQELVITSEPSYYKWTQWLFLKLMEHNLAYKAESEVNYCKSCETVLANEQVINNSCERCGNKTESKILNQWFFKITAYKERLLKNLEIIDYPEKTKKMQKAWLENLHDWCVSRQRSWGTPIPLENETDTLDTFVDSSFYYIRYCDPYNNEQLCSKEKYKQVDLYIGGSEHACMHLIYARFINMFLFDIGIVSEEEPFKKVIHQGMILRNGIKMSKSKGNVINPSDFNSDELRFFLMFIGHYFDGGDFKDSSKINGIKRFISRIKKWPIGSENIDSEINKLKTQIFNYTESFKFNKVVSEFMSFYNKYKNTGISENSKNYFLELLEIYMPGIKKT